MNLIMLHFYIVMIFLFDLLALSVLFIFGKLAVEKESKDTWNDIQSMECTQAEKLSKVWTAKHPILDFFQDCYYEIKRKLEIPGDTYRNIKWFIQRGRRGFSDCDVWGLDYYLAELIANTMKELNEQVHGVPGDLAEKFKDKNDPDGVVGAMVEWKRILNVIEWTFATAHKVKEHDWIYVSDERQRAKLTKFYKRVEKHNPDYQHHVMTKKECKAYKEGWKYFQKYFFSLWD